MGGKLDGRRGDFLFDPWTESADILWRISDGNDERNIRLRHHPALIQVFFRRNLNFHCLAAGAGIFD